MQLNASRIKVLQAQDDVVNAMKDAAAKELLNVSSDHHVYKRLLKDLIVQVCNSILSLSVRFEKKKKSYFDCRDIEFMHLDMSVRVCDNRRNSNGFSEYRMRGFEYRRNLSKHDEIWI